MDINRWHMNRMGLVDFWCYENEVFEFDDGHILLRGTNGSGKSVTLQSFIPLLLDGNKSSERLDTFGSTSRKMDTYLIDENSDRDERIGYLWLEFKKEALDLYTTIGMGLRAKKNKTLQSWYFVIEDNRRIGIDVQLMENHLTLSMRQLKNMIGDQVLEKQADYMKKVNDVLFGFESIEDYKDALNLLLQLRMPKLSNSLSPDKLNELLSKSLRPLSEEDLRPMSEAMQNMDNLQDELDTLKQSEAALSTIYQAYRTYNEVQLIDKYQKYLEQANLLKQYQEDLNQIIENEKNLQDESEQLEETLKQTQIQTEILSQEKNSLLNQDMERLHEEMVNLEKEITTSKKEVERKKLALATKEERKVELEHRMKKVENDVGSQQRYYKKALKELNSIYDEFPFSEHIALKLALEKEEKFNFTYTKQALKNELKIVNEGLNQWLQINHLNKQKEVVEDDLSKNEFQMEAQASAISQAEATYEGIIKEYQEHFYKLGATNKYLQLSRERLNEITNILVSYEQTQDYFTITKIIQNVYFNIKSNLQNQLLNHQYELSKLNQKENKIKNEIKDWTNRKEIEPERDDDINHNRQTLQSLGIQYQSFYQLLEFNEDLSQEEKNQIENLLSQMHLLDALIVHKNDQEKILDLHNKDYYLWTSKKVNELKVVEIGKNNLLDVLNQLGITNTKDFKITPDYFESGIIYGTYNHMHQAQFIGVTSREQLRQQKLHELNNELMFCKEEIQKVNDQISSISKDIKGVEEEYHSFKTEDDLKTAYKMVEDEKVIYQQLQYQKANLERQIKELNDQVSEIKKKLKVISEKILVDITQEAFENRKECIEDYEMELDTLKNAYENYFHLSEMLSSFAHQLEEINCDIDEFVYEIETIKSKLSIQKGKHDNISRQLESMGYANIQQRLKEVEKELQDLNIAYRSYLEKRGYYESELEKAVVNKQEGAKRVEVQIRTERIYLDVLNQEMDYHFIFKNDLSLRELGKELRQLISKMNQKKTIHDYETQLLQTFFEQNPYLTEYRPTREVDPLIHEIEGMNGHLILKAMHMGKVIPIEELRVRLKENIETQALLIAQEDRKIFEDILVNTISKKIRAHIHSSRRWVDKMHRYMQAMNTSSGLQLSLRWRPKKSSVEGELDTSELVDLLDKDSHLLKEGDRQKIANHFKSKIEYARKLSEDENTTKSFHQLLKEVMNYRDWFDFTIYAQKPNEAKKELTKKIFGAYSGGEKAIVMLVPLFSAVTAKLESARPDAPLLIALDEAFAGVDENNIDSLFELIEKFQFDYIMNSQVLWGDYPSCKSLAIYELFRPNNAPYVATVAYHWNGHQRTVRING